MHISTNARHSLGPRQSISVNDRRTKHRMGECIAKGRVRRAPRMRSEGPSQVKVLKSNSENESRILEDLNLGTAVDI